MYTIPKHVQLMLMVLLKSVNIASASKIDSKIYRTILNPLPCVLLTNATHQIGCTSDMKGNRGIVHFVKNNEDLEWLMETGPHSPYVPLLPSSMFNRIILDRLMASKKISGALVFHTNNQTTSPPQGFSPDSTCPMDNFGMYGKDKEYGSCKKIEWNPIGNGMSFVYYGIPIFLLTIETEINHLIKCYEKHNEPENGTARGYPLCAVEMKDFMFAAKDTPTCRRKTELYNLVMNTYCDPLEDRNIYGTLYPMVGKIKKDDIIMVATRLDSTAFFHEFAPGADNGVTGIVTLLAAAYALGAYKRNKNLNNTEDLKPIMFTFFNGEVWDYIGSSRMIWDMQKGTFPYEEPNKNNDDSGPVNDEMYTSKFDVSNIGYFIELSQLGLGTSIYAHTDPISQKIPGVKGKVDEILKYLENSTAESGTKFEVVNRDQKIPLPPASFQRFLRKRNNIPGIVLTDHEKQFANMYYNSRFDNAGSVDVQAIPILNDNNTYSKIRGRLRTNLTELSEAVANTLYLLASGGVPPKEKIKVPLNLTANLLYCLLISASCPSFKQILPKKHNKLPPSPLSRYISVKQIDNPNTNLIHRLLAYYTGEYLPEESCTKARSKLKLPKALSYMVINNDTISTNCIRSSVYLTPALSPAFEISDYTSTEYSTWTESMWNADMGIQMYLVADPKIEGITLAAGMVILLISFGVVYFMMKQATVLFTPNTGLVQESVN